MARVFLSPKVVGAPIYLYHPGGKVNLGEVDATLVPPTLAGEPRRPELARAGDLRVSWGDLLAHDSPRRVGASGLFLPRGIEFFLNHKQMYGIWEGCLLENDRLLKIRLVTPFTMSRVIESRLKTR
jgi:hypothetical protein